MQQKIANATFQVVCGNSVGSGFSFLYDDLVVTNFHVVKPIIDFDTKSTTENPFLISEDGFNVEAKVISCDSDNDIALLQISKPLPGCREVLQPIPEFVPSRGRRVIFSGFPHGMPYLLTSEATISAPMENGQFCIDGMVNNGNSGGPIVDAETGFVIGIVTQRRFHYGEQAEELQKSALNILHVIKSYPENMRLIQMNIDVGELNRIMTESLVLFTDMLKQNANSGIGIGFPITPVINMIERLFPKKDFIVKY